MLGPLGPSVLALREYVSHANQNSLSYIVASAYRGLSRLGSCFVDMQFLYRYMQIFFEFPDIAIAKFCRDRCFRGLSAFKNFKTFSCSFLQSLCNVGMFHLFQIIFRLCS